MRVAVVMGGASGEREVSLATGVQVARALREAGHEVTAVDTARGPVARGEEEALLEAGVQARPPDPEELRTMEGPGLLALLGREEVTEADVVFVALHGGSGEDGTIQALLDVAGVSYTGSGQLGCALAMDKTTSKRLFRDAGIRETGPWTTAPLAEGEAERIGFPMVVKPNGAGSTIGLSLVREPGRLEAAVAEARRYDPEVIAERYIDGRELTVPVLGEEALPVGEIIPEHEIFDYACKYQPGLAREVFPAEISGEVEERVRSAALRGHRTLKLRGYSRIDFLLDAEGGLWCLEANALPGMTSASLVPQSAAAAGVPFPELCDRIVRMAAGIPAVRR